MADWFVPISFTLFYFPEEEFLIEGSFFWDFLSMTSAWFFYWSNFFNSLKAWTFYLCKLAIYDLLLIEVWPLSGNSTFFEMGLSFLISSIEVLMFTFLLEGSLATDCLAFWDLSLPREEWLFYWELEFSLLDMN
jgi:hypothetical protein